MNVKSSIEEKLSRAIPLQFLQVINESGQHHVPAGSQSHFKLILVSDEFIGMALLARHRRINALLADELRDRIHALAVHAYTAEEWQAKQHEAPSSPPCAGGSLPTEAADYKTC